MVTRPSRLGLARLAAVALGVAVLAGACSRATYEGVELSPYVPEPYRNEVAEALRTAGDNGPTILGAITEAPEEDREALAFLVANLPPVDLATVDGAFLLETVRLAREARRAFPWGPGVPDDVYLRYVLPPRVSQEPLERWRGYLLEQLAPRLDGIGSMEEAALEVNRWCGEHVGFKPTQRRDQGVFETLASGYGRCEEMMIVHISALRSVAIPARQTWTPYWATGDNNHAWTEVWVDGEWHYAGACEPSDRLDDAWFNDSVKGAALVCSSVFGPPADGEDVYREEERYSIVNSVGHYLEPGTLVASVEARGRPARSVPVTISVWNFGALRAIARRETDADGAIDIRLGDGTYFVCAGGPSGHDWSLAEVEAGSEARVSLDLDRAPHFDAGFWLRYSEED
jgi:hypothetical protein